MNQSESYRNQFFNPYLTEENRMYPIMPSEVKIERLCATWQEQYEDAVRANR